MRIRNVTVMQTRKTCNTVASAISAAQKANADHVGIVQCRGGRGGFMRKRRKVEIIK